MWVINSLVRWCGVCAFRFFDHGCLRSLLSNSIIIIILLCITALTILLDRYWDEFFQCSILPVWCELHFARRFLTEESACQICCGQKISHDVFYSIRPFLYNCKSISRPQSILFGHYHIIQCIQHGIWACFFIVVSHIYTYRKFPNKGAGRLEKTLGERTFPASRGFLQNENRIIFGWDMARNPEGLGQKGAPL